MFRIKACEGIYHYLSLKLISSHFYFRLFYSTFNIPEIINYRTIVGTNDNFGFYTNGGIPNLYGEIGRLSGFDNNITKQGVFSQSTIEYNTLIHLAGENNAILDRLFFNAEQYNSIYGAIGGDKVVPKSVTVQFCIKY